MNSVSELVCCLSRRNRWSDLNEFWCGDIWDSGDRSRLFFLQKEGEIWDRVRGQPRANASFLITTSSPHFYAKKTKCQSQY